MKEKGHTLIELVVVLTIIATLIALALPRYLSLIQVVHRLMD